MILFLAVATVCLASSRSTPAKAPELKNDKKLRNELRRRGFTEMLDLLLTEHAPDDQAEAKLAQRAIRLQKANRPGTAPAPRIKLIQEAVHLLEELIDNRPKDPRRFDWQMDLGHDIIYQLAEPYCNDILFRGGSEKDRTELLKLADKAEDVLDALQKDLADEYERLDSLDPDDFQRRLKTGYVERVEELRPLAAYFFHWARFYRALALPPADPEAKKILEQVVTYMSVTNQFTTLDHARTGVQAQALWITGIAQRLLGKFDEAFDFLTKAVEVVEKLPDEKKNELTWVLVLARLEQVKTRRDQGKFDQAVQAAETFRKWAHETLPDNFAVLEAIALLEGTIFKKHADLLRKKGNADQAAKLDVRSRKPLIELARTHPKHQDRIYQTVYEMLGEVKNLAALDSFEKYAYVVGLLRDARRAAAEMAAEKDRENKKTLRAERDTKLDQAIHVGRQLLKDDSELARQLRPNALFSLAISYFQRGQASQAVDAFLELLENHPEFERAEAAAESAVQLAHEQMRKPGGPSSKQKREKFIQAANIYINRYPNTPDANHWRLLLARSLEAAGQFPEAAHVYDQIPQDHPRYLDAGFFGLQSRVRSVDPTAGSSDAKMKINQCADQAEHIAKQAHAAADNTDDPKRKRTLHDLSASATLMAAELYAGPALQQREKALTLLANLEKQIKLDQIKLDAELIGRALRLRIVALQGLGRLDQASALVADYLARESGNAGAVVQGLLGSVRREIARDRHAGRNDAADRRAAEALDLARRLYDWAQKNAAKLNPGDLPAFILSLAEASLEAHRYADALKWFGQCDGKFTQNTGDDRRRRGAVQYGHAEALYHLKQYKQALPLFHDLWRGTPPQSRLWWQALLRNLQCHHKVGTNPATIRKSILQHRRPHPDMGGLEIKAEFDRLEKQLR